jgi:hypothetical protein
MPYAVCHTRTRLMATEIAGLTEDQIAERRAAPNWAQPVALAPAMAREARIEEGWDW